MQPKSHLLKTIYHSWRRTWIDHSLSVCHRSSTYNEVVYLFQPQCSCGIIAFVVYNGGIVRLGSLSLMLANTLNPKLNPNTVKPIIICRAAMTMSSNEHWQRNCKRIELASRMCNIGFDVSPFFLVAVVWRLFGMIQHCILGHLEFMPCNSRVDQLDSWMWTWSPPIDAMQF